MTFVTINVRFTFNYRPDVQSRRYVLLHWSNAEVFCKSKY